MSMFAEVLLSAEEKREQQKIETLKREGYPYFRVQYFGRNPIETVKIQGLVGIIATPYEAEDGTTQYHTSEGSEAYFCKLDDAGRKVFDIYDDPETLNRHWVASNTFDYAGRKIFEPLDDAIKNDINKIIDEYKNGKEFKVELNDLEEAEKELKKYQERVAKLRAEKGEAVKPEIQENAEEQPERRKNYRNNIKEE